jgi:hypothetical protein
MSITGMSEKEMSEFAARLVEAARALHALEKVTREKERSKSFATPEDQICRRVYRVGSCRREGGAGAIHR